MSSGWHWLVILLTLGNIGAMWWLIAWSHRQGDSEKAHEDTLDHVWDEDLQERNQPLPRWWLMLFNATIVFSLGYLALYPGLGNFQGIKRWTQLTQYQTEKEEMDAIHDQTFKRLAGLNWPNLEADEEGRKVGANLFSNHCATCHGADGGGAPGFPSLKDGDWLYGGDYETIETSITYGRNGVMTPMGTALQGMNVATEDMVEKVKSLSGISHDAAAAARAEAGWPLCMACHGPEGKGNQTLGAPNLSDDIWLYGSSDAAIAESINRGRNNTMPANQDLLTADQIRVLAAYVHGLSKQ